MITGYTFLAPCLSSVMIDPFTYEIISLRQFLKCIVGARHEVARM
jgi:hypothetical protein